MVTIRSWQQNRDMWVRVLERQTGHGVKAWNSRISRRRLESEHSLRAWLTEQGVTGYAQSLLVMEQFGYPDFLVASAGELIRQQYADRLELKPVYEAIVTAAAQTGTLIIQARKSYVSLVTPRRTFARVQPTTRSRIDLGLRLEGRTSRGRLLPSRIHETMSVKVSLASVADVDAEVRGWLRQAYRDNS